MRHKPLAVGLILVAFAAAVTAQQDKNQRPSPPGTAETTIKGKKVTINYSRPSLRGRKMDTLTPSGKVWRTGANEATALKTETDLTIGGAHVPAGSYTLYSVPSEAGPWKLIINKQTGQWGTEYQENQDLVRVDMKKSALAVPVEQFTISFDQTGPDSADLIMEWENTRVSVPVKAASAK